MALLQGAAARCCCKVLVSECCLRFGVWLLMPLQGAAIAGPAAESAGSLVLLQSAGAGMLLQLQGVIARCALWSSATDAAGRVCCEPTKT